VRADPRMVTRIIVRFEGYTGRYMWHCHILEHGDNEMMRPSTSSASEPFSVAEFTQAGHEDTKTRRRTNDHHDRAAVS
jgi:hypothetical protein